MTTTCAICERTTGDQAYACARCASRAAGHLAAIVELAPDARLVAAGLVRRGRGGGGGKPGSRPPLNDGATDALAEVQNMITTLARDITETRGLTFDLNGPRARLRAPHSDQQAPVGHRDTPEPAETITGGS